MTTLFIIILISIYFLSGFCSFVYWWTKDYDFTTADILLALFMSLFGPLIFIVGWTIHGKAFDKILIKKKGG